MVLLGCCVIGFDMRGAAAATPATLAYYESNSQAALRVERSYLSEVAADLYGIDAAGNVSGTLLGPLKAVAYAAHIRLFATVSNFGAHGFSQAIAHAVLTDSAVLARALAGIRSLATNAALAGVNIDFENISNKDRAAYSAFVASTAKILHAAGSLEVVSVPAALSNDPDDSWTGARLTYIAADGSDHVVWYEDARSARIKAAVVPAHRLAGVSVYALGFDDPVYWRAIKQGLKP